MDKKDINVPSNNILIKFIHIMLSGKRLTACIEQIFNKNAYQCLDKLQTSPHLVETHQKIYFTFIPEGVLMVPIGVRRTYGYEFNRKAVRLVDEQGYKAAEIDRNLGIGTNIVPSIVPRDAARHTISLSVN